MGGRQGLAPEGPTHPTGAEVLDWIFCLPAEQLTVAPGMQSVKRGSHTAPRSCAGQPYGAVGGQFSPINWSLQLLSHYARELGAPGRQVRAWAERQREGSLNLSFLGLLQERGSWLLFPNP